MLLKGVFVTKGVVSSPLVGHNVKLTMFHLGNITLVFFVSYETFILPRGHLRKAKNYTISSDTHQLQFIKLHHFKQERF